MNRLPIALLKVKVKVKVKSKHPTGLKAQRYCFLHGLLAALIAAVLIVGWGTYDAAHAAKTPFGVGVPEEAGPASWAGPFSGFFVWVASQQAAFSQSIQASLKDLSTDGAFPFWLITLSFIYGVLHAVGPGHGKIIISSYVLATNAQARRGIALAFASAFVQACTAIAMGGFAVLVFNITSIGISQTTESLVLLSYAIVTAIGAWLVWTRAFRSRPLKVAGPQSQATHPGHARVDDDHEAGATARQTLTACACGHSHIADPHDLKQALSWKNTWPLILAVGIRPCTGALIVLAFAMALGIFWAGVLATFAMALGTALTVAFLAWFAVSAKSLAVQVAREQSKTARGIARGIEIVGSFAVFFLGLSLLISALGFAAT